MNNLLESVESIKDEQLPKILFLVTNLTQKSESSIAAFQSAMSKMKKSLEARNMDSLRKDLVRKLLDIKEYLVCEQLPDSGVQNYFSDEKPIEKEEEILIYYDIFRMLSIEVPPYLKEKNDSILKNNLIPKRKEQNGRVYQTFFVHSENKVHNEICDIINYGDVYRMYDSYKKMKLNDYETIDILKKELTYSSMKDIPGLKEVAFYFLVLHMINHKKLNRIYTHNLDYMLKLVKSEYGNPDDISRLVEAKRKLLKYPISSYPPGICIIFCMIKGRPGSEKDLKAVEQLFGKKYHYDVLVKLNPTSKDIQSVSSKLDEHRNKYYDSLVVWFMGHGTNYDLVVADKKIDRRSGFIELFCNIKWLNMKPKLFFIQACAKDDRDFDAVLQSGPTQAMKAQMDSYPHPLKTSQKWQCIYDDFLDISMINNYADTIIALATKWHELAARNEKGSIYVQTVVEFLTTKGHKKSIEVVLRKVNYIVNQLLLEKKIEEKGSEEYRQWKQTPFYESSLQKEFLFPGTVGHEG